MATLARLRRFPLSRQPFDAHIITRTNPNLSSQFQPSTPPLPLPHTSSFLSPLLLSKFLQTSHFSHSAANDSSSNTSGCKITSDSSLLVRPIGTLLNGWRSRVAADPQFPFKILMEQLVGVSASVLGDMATRPNFGLNELDFVFSTLVVSSILNFVLMYLLAPTISSASTSALPSIFSNCPTSHMFEPGSYTFFNRFGTFVYKGVVFAAIGFAAGLVGTAISNGLIKMRKMLDPNFEVPNKPPPMVLNAATWAIHMGVSSNLRYQTLNGIEFLLAKMLPQTIFRSSVVVLRCFNNVIGGVSFVILARLTGSQSVEEREMKQGLAAEEEKLLNGDDSSSR